MKIFLRILFYFATVLLSGCAGLSQYFEYWDQCDKEVMPSFPKVYEKKFIRTETVCSDVVSVNNTRKCISEPIYENVDKNESARNAARDTCIQRKKFNGGR